MSGSGTGTPISVVVDVTIEKYIDLFWPTLKTTLDGFHPSVFPELIDDTVNILAKYNTKHLTETQKKMVRALIVCSQASSMAYIPGFKEDKFLSQFKTGSITKTKDGLDLFTEEIKQYIPNYNEIAEIDRSWFPETTFRKNSAYLAPKLDTRERKLLGNILLTEIRDDEWDGER